MRVTGWREFKEMTVDDYREEHLTLRGAGLHLMRSGEGPPVLFLHGAGGAPEWTPFMTKLAEQFDLLVPDHPGFGYSDSPEWIESVSDLAYFYLDLLQTLDLRDVHLVGNSLGGWIAAEMAVRCTGRFASLTLLASAGIHVSGVPKGDIFMWSAEETVRNLFANPEMVEMALSRVPDGAQIDILLKNRLAAARYGWQPRFYNPDLHKWLHRIDVPTLILWGDSDRIFPPAYAAAFGELIPHARVTVLADCGHLPQVERTDDFLEQFRALVAEAGA